MPFDRCNELHEIHSRVAAQLGHDFVRSPQVSVSTFRKDAMWSSVIELACVEADRKRAISLHYGIRSESVEQHFTSFKPHSPTLSTLMALDPAIDNDVLLERLNQASAELEQLLDGIDSTAAIIQKVEEQGGATLVFGSWTHSNSFPSGRTADEIRQAIRAP
jgi:hypothetical protein